ncbi:hypothetical protein AB4254_08195 [Vibrio breoganii]
MSEKKEITLEQWRSERAAHRAEELGGKVSFKRKICTVLMLSVLFSGVFAAYAFYSAVQSIYLKPSERESVYTLMRSATSKVDMADCVTVGGVGCYDVYSDDIKAAYHSLMSAHSGESDIGWRDYEQRRVEALKQALIASYLLSTGSDEGLESYAADFSYDGVNVVEALKVSFKVFVCLVLVFGLYVSVRISAGSGNRPR